MPIPYHKLPSLPVDAPAIDKSAAKALKVLDKDLVVFFSRYHITPACEIARNDLGQPVGEWPRWSVALWSRTDNRFYRIMTLNTTDMDYHPFDMRTVNALRSDVLRVKGLKGAINHRAEMREKEKEAAKKQLAADRKDWEGENEKKIREVKDNPHYRYATHRNMKSFGFSNQAKRDTSGKLIKKTTEELGWSASEALERRENNGEAETDTPEYSSEKSRKRGST